MIQRIYKIHIFKFFRLFIEGIIWFLLHFYAIQAISHIEVFLRFHFYLMQTHVEYTMLLSLPLKIYMHVYRAA